MSRLRPDAPEEASSTDAGRAILSNTGALVAGRYVVAALGWAGTLLIVRDLSVDAWGRFSFVFALLGLLTVVTDLGIGRVAVRGMLDTSRDTGAFAGTYVVLRAVLGLLGYLAALCFVVAAGYPPEVVHATALAGVVVLVATPSNALDTIFQAHLCMRTVAVAVVLGQVVQLAMTAAIAASQGSVVVYTLPAVAAEFVIVAWKLRVVRRLVRLRFVVDWPAWKALLREAAPIAVGGMLATLYFRVDSVLLSWLGTFAAVGVYGVAYKFVDLLHFLPVALLAPVLTVLVRAWPDDPLTFGHTVHRAMILLLLAGVLVVVEFALFARPVITLLYGERYAEGAGATRVVVIAECLGAQGRLAFTALVAMGRHRLYPAATLTGLVVNVGLNVWLIPTHSYWGAAVATLVTEVLVVAILWVPMARLDVLRPFPLRPVVGGALAGLVAAAAGAGVAALAPWQVAALVVAAIYLAALHFGRVPGPEGLLTLVRDVRPDVRREPAAL